MFHSPPIVKFKLWEILFYLASWYIIHWRYINIREYRRCNQKWTIQRKWQDREHKTSTNKTKTQNNMCWTPLCAIYVPLLCVLPSEFRVVMSVTISAYKRCSLCLYIQSFVGGPMSYLRYLCLLAHNVKTKRTTFVCGNRNGHHNTELRR
jgi:hypothetical protein